ncbi:MAG TPA: PKD domain-containing protein [Solirubrobacteraceae bacterium]|nr:PKD domain-containing protein [Solirubrobacteraceae bacterium]
MLWTTTALVVPLVVAVGAQAALLKPGAVAGASQKLAPGLQRVATPAVRSASPAAQARQMSLPARGPGSPVRLGSRFVVTARVSSTAPAVVRGLRGAGAQILTVSARYGMITVAVAPADLGRIAALTSVRSVQPELQPLTAAQGRATAAPKSFPEATPAALTCPWGSVRSEGDAQLDADQARSAFGIDGSGAEVGIISDSFDTSASAATHASDDVSNGDLPGRGNPCGFTSPVQDVLDSPGGSDEGRAMAQVVHDLAPGAPLAFASGATASTNFPNVVGALRSAGAKVIADDVTYLDEPFFQDGPAAVAVNNAAAAGIPYFSSAANDNVFDDSGDNVSSWEAPSYRPTSCPTTPDFSGVGYLDCMDFDPSGGTSSTGTFTLAPDASFGLDLQWSEPWFGVNTDLDAFLLDSSNNILSRSDDVNPGPNGSQEPVEFFGHTNTTGADQTVKLVIARFPSDTPGTPRVKYVLIGASGISSVQFPTSSGGDIVGPTIFGHNGAAGAMSIAAVPFFDSTKIEPFSSRGPVTHYFGPVTSTTPAAPLGSPETLAKPDAAATDGAATSFFAELIGGVWRFFGTSEAAPHAAALAALLRQAYPQATVSQIYNEMKSTAVQVGTFGPDAEGSGLLDAFAAVGSGLTGSPTAAFGVSPPAPVAGAPVSFDGSGSSDPNAGAVITKYSWNFGDGTASSGASSSVSHGYLNPGTYAVTLTVADSLGQTAAVSHLVTIATAPPPALSPTPAPTPTPVPRAVCKVPNVKRKSLTAARRALRAHHCAVGRITSPHKPKRGPGKHKKWVRVVTRESPAAGRTLPSGSKVALTLTWRAVRK